MRNLVMIAVLMSALPAYADDVPKPTFTLTAEEAVVVAQWAAEKRAIAQQQYSQADAVLTDLQKQAPKTTEKK